QRLETSDLTTDERLRLGIQFQLVTCGRREEVGLESSLLAQPFVHVGFEEADRAALSLLITKSLIAALYIANCFSALPYRVFISLRIAKFPLQSWSMTVQYIHVSN